MAKRDAIKTDRLNFKNLYYISTHVCKSGKLLSVGASFINHTLLRPSSGPTFSLLECAHRDAIVHHHHIDTRSMKQLVLVL
jgi:hypothetical protein